MKEVQKIKISWISKLREINVQEHPSFYCQLRFEDFEDFKYMVYDTDDGEINTHRGNFLNNSLKRQFDLTDGTLKLFRIHLN